MAHLTRRQLLAATAAAPLAAQQGEFVLRGKKPMIVHNDFPEDLESLPEYLASWITPNDSFFVRQHLPVRAWMRRRGALRRAEW